MKVSERISLLIIEADKLRTLHDDDPAKLPLTVLVDQINELRATMEAPGFFESEDAMQVHELVDVEDDPEQPDQPPEKPKGKPGRKPKGNAAIEGADAK